MIIEAKFRKNGVLTNVTSVVLASADGTYGIKRNDTGASVVAAGTPMTLVSGATGRYEYEFTAPDTAVLYTRSVKVTYNDSAYFVTEIFSAVGPATDPSDSNCYLTAFDEDNEPEEGVVFEFMMKTADGVAGTSHPRSTRSRTSDAIGGVAINCLKNSVQVGRRIKADGKPGPWVEFSVGELDQTPIPQILGKVLLAP